MPKSGPPAIELDEINSAVEAVHADRSDEAAVSPAARPAKPVDEWARKLDRTTEASFKIVVQVMVDRVWVAAFFGPGRDSKFPGQSLSFGRPPGKTATECTKRALKLIGTPVPEDLSAPIAGGDDW